MTLTKLAAVLCVAVLVGATPAQPDKPAPKAGGGLASALWLAHQFGDPPALTPGKDRELKVKLTTALAKNPALAWGDVEGLFDKATFQKLGGGGAALSPEAMDKLLREKTPPSRTDTNPKVRLHADLLTTQFDMIDDGHRKAVQELAGWIVKNYRPGKPLGVVCICTRNTRRSALSATMGNVAASYYGLTGLRFTCGGTTPDAINSRTIATLKEIGLDIEPTGKEATRGQADEPNPVYRIRWGKGLEAAEFSKKYTDPPNPTEGFAALMVCSEADEACPMVAGASARIPVRFLDPKSFDGTPFEAAKYAERRDDIGRFMLSAVMQARRQLDLDGKLK